MTHTQTSGSVRAVLVVADIVLEQALSTVVGEALSQLDNGDEVGRGRQVLADAAQSSLLVVVGLLAIGSWDHLGILLIVLGGVGIRPGDVATSHVLVRSGHTLSETLMEATEVLAAAQVRGLPWHALSGGILVVHRHDVGLRVIYLEWYGITGTKVMDVKEMRVADSPDLRFLKTFRVVPLSGSGSSTGHFLRIHARDMDLEMAICYKSFATIGCGRRLRGSPC